MVTFVPPEIFVVTTHYSPRIERFEVLKETEKSYIVKTRGGQKVVRKNADRTHHVFVTREGALNRRKEWYNEKRTQLSNEMQKMANALAVPDDKVGIEDASQPWQRGQPILL